VGAGMATVQTAGLALATDLSADAKRPQVVALLYVMLIAGMLVSSLVLGRLLADFQPTRLVQVIQGLAVITLLLNVVALWKQEARRPANTRSTLPRGDFAASWQAFAADRTTRRLLIGLGLGAAGFAMQDVLLEPYGGQVLGLDVGETTALSALWSAGMLAGFALAARLLARHADAHRMAACGALVGIVAFTLVVLSAPLASVALLCAGAAGIGCGGGLFAVDTLIAVMGLARKDVDSSTSGLALGAWGAVQASAAGVAILFSGVIRDGVGAAAMAGRLGAGLASHATGYSMVWHIEIALLFATLIALGPLVGRVSRQETFA
jgi:MFS transporter, BCD family, chlorophyll transporter